jgi:ribosomal-protein-alanine N-acetyltransferase
LGFRHWRDADLPLALGLWGDPEVTIWIGGPFTPDAIAHRLANEIVWQSSTGLQYWPIFLLDGGDHVGCCGLRSYRPQDAIHEIGFHMRREFWGRGFAAEAARAVIRYAFVDLHVSALFAGHNPNNEASRRLLLRLGFEYTHDEFYAPTGLMHPSYLLRGP